MENREQGVMGVADTGSDRSYIDWPAILAGVAVSVAIGVLAAGFGAALGLTGISARQGEGSGQLAMIISAIWIVVSTVCAYATGGYIAGRMRRRVDAATRDEITVRDGMNGLTVWGVGIVISAMLLGSLIGNTVSAVGKVAEVAGTAAGTAAGAMVPHVVGADPMAFVAGTMLRPATVTPGMQPTEAMAADAGAILANLATSGAISDADRAYLVQVTVARTGLTEADAAARVAAAEQAAQDARTKVTDLAAQAEQVARDTAEAARISAILTAFLLTAMSLVAGVASYIAAVKGGRHRDEGQVFRGFAYHK